MEGHSMIDQDTTLHLAEAFRDRWLDEGGPELGAIMDLTEQGKPSAFILATPPLTYANAVLAAQKAKKEAQLTCMHTTVSGISFPAGVPELSPVPAFIVAPMGRWEIAYFLYLNAETILRSSEGQYKTLSESGQAELATWQRSVDDPLALLNLQMNQRNKLSYPLDELTLTGDQRTIRTLMQTMGI